eukprot:1136871-Pleurochrysis_carterae.AAC.1
MLACDVPSSANNYTIYSPIHAACYVPNRYVISKSCIPTKYRHHVTPTSYPPTIGLLARRLPTIYIKQFAICGHITDDYVSPPGQLSRRLCFTAMYTPLIGRRRGAATLRYNFGMSWHAETHVHAP